MTEPRPRDVQERIRQVLLRGWDPIGVAEEPGAQDEYDSYVGAVYRLLASNASEQQIAAHLGEIEAEYMGLPPRDPATLLPVVRELMALSIGLGRKTAG